MTLTVDDVVERAQRTHRGRGSRTEALRRQPRGDRRQHERGGGTQSGRGRDGARHADGRAPQPHGGRPVRRRRARRSTTLRSSRRSSSPGCHVRVPPTSSTCSTRTPRCGCCAPGRVNARCRRPRSTPRRCNGVARRASRTPGSRAGDRREDRRVPPHRCRRAAGVPGHPRPDVREPRAPLDHVGRRLPRLPAPHRRPAGGLRLPRRVLKLLQWGSPERRWTLKWPCHLLALDAIAAVYPDAKFVVTHRDPVQALASNCSLTQMLREGTSPNADPHQIGRDMLELVGQHVNRLVAFDREQEAAGSDRLVHVDYYSLVDAPEAVMPDVFAAIDLDWTPDVEERIRVWRAENPKGKRGTHEYRLDDYGLDRATRRGGLLRLHRAVRHPERGRARPVTNDPVGWSACFDDLRDGRRSSARPHRIGRLRRSGDRRRGEDVRHDHGDLPHTPLG